MPVVFSPGEAETRPLDPDAIVYTTAQKVANLLGIGRGEAVLMSANAEANAVFVTGGDYRDHGFEVNDILLIYSDADPMGQEVTITAITSTTSGVKLTFTVNADGVSSINPGLYETADNGYVQNTASFTNGKTRGVTKAHVETIIKEIQDRIDNITHNAWRPYLATAEYHNFDTYKPYRRRYYTDYVGTISLLFRNVQQMLRIELWQGNEYREVCSAEVRLDIADYTELSGDAVFLCPGGGGFAKLAVGTGPKQWQADFNKVTTAQNLADLINKEDRTNRGTVTFTTDATSPDGTTYTLPDGSSSTGVSNVHVHNEFLATANSDYGSGVIKLTSMQPAGGTEATIASTDTTNIVLSRTETASASGTINKSLSDGSRTITFADSSDFTEYGVVRASTGTVYGYTSNSGTVLGGCRALHADGSVTHNTAYTWTQHKLSADLQGGATSVVVDAITGETTVDRSSSGDKARLKDWWLDPEMGIIYFNNSYPYFEWNAVKVSYIYGERYVEKAIEQAATKLVCVDLLMADDRSVLIPEGTQNVDLASKIQLYRQEADTILRRYKEVVVFE